MDTLYTVKQVAEILNCRKPAIYRLLRVGELRGHRLGKTGPWRIPSESVQELLERNEVSGLEWNE